MSLICPLCQHPLSLQHAGWRCDNHHQFDQAKEGYVNLLPAQHKGSREPGDSAEMMQARRAFLDAGHYQPLQQKVADWLSALLPASASKLLDIGCGEGYYTAAVADALHQRESAEVFGLDVAKVAIRAAAKRYRDILFCVASSNRLPFANASLDAILRIYAPCNEQELKRVVKPGGYLLTVTPGPRHLLQFKALIYREVRLHTPEEKSYSGFTRIEQQRLDYPMQLSGPEAKTLLQMTPFAWRAREEVWQTLAQADSFSCEADFCLTLWQRD